MLADSREILLERSIGDTRVSPLEELGGTSQELHCVDALLVGTRFLSCFPTRGTFVAGFSLIVGNGIQPGAPPCLSEQGFGTAGSVGVLPPIVLCFWSFTGDSRSPVF